MVCGARCGGCEVHVTTWGVRDEKSRYKVRRRARVVHLAWQSEGLEKEGLKVIGIACKGPSSLVHQTRYVRMGWKESVTNARIYGFGRWQYQHGRASVILSPVPGAFHRGSHRGSSP